MGRHTGEGRQPGIPPLSGDARAPRHRGCPPVNDAQSAPGPVIDKNGAPAISVRTCALGSKRVDVVVRVRRGGERGWENDLHTAIGAVRDAADAKGTRARNAYG